VGFNPFDDPEDDATPSLTPSPVQVQPPIEIPLPDFLQTEEDAVYKRYREDIKDSRRGPWVAQMIKTFGKLGMSHPEARVLSVSSMPTANGKPWTSPDGPLATDGEISLADAWEATRGSLDDLAKHIKVEAKSSWAFKVQNYGAALRMQLAMKKPG